MQEGSFQLRKWASNAPKLLRHLSVLQSEVTNYLLIKNKTIKACHGFLMTMSFDSLFILYKTYPSVVYCSIFSRRLSKTLDPLGWAAPVVVVAKIFLQELWLLCCEWDAPLPEESATLWADYTVDLVSLNSVRIPRWIDQLRDNQSLEIHGFADASIRAYATVIFLPASDKFLISHSN